MVSTGQDFEVIPAYWVCLKGSISRIKQSSEHTCLWVQDPDLGSRWVEITSKTEIPILTGGRQPIGQTLMEWVEGQSVRIMGRQLSNGSVLAMVLSGIPASA